MIFVLDGLNIIPVQLIYQHNNRMRSFTLSKNTLNNPFTIFIPTADNDVPLVVDGFQTFSLLDLPFNQDRSHGGCDERKECRSTQDDDETGNFSHLADGYDIAITHRGYRDHSPPYSIKKSSDALLRIILIGKKDSGSAKEDHGQRDGYDSEELVLFKRNQCLLHL